MAANNKAYADSDKQNLGIKHALTQLRSLTTTTDGNICEAI